MTNMEVIFTHELIHQRFISDSIRKARIKWRKIQSWYPVEQDNNRKEADRIYKEIREKYGDAAFEQYVKERRLNKRLYATKEDLGQARKQEKPALNPICLTTKDD